MPKKVTFYNISLKLICDEADLVSAHVAVAPVGDARNRLGPAESVCGCSLAGSGAEESGVQREDG